MVFYRKRYLKNRGNLCPCCGDPQIEGGFVEVDDGSAKQNVVCLVCGEEWQDIYALIDVKSL